jgi:hypothetical protein
MWRRYSCTYLPKFRSNFLPPSSGYNPKPLRKSGLRSVLCITDLFPRAAQSYTLKMVAGIFSETVVVTTRLHGSSYTVLQPIYFALIIMRISHMRITMWSRVCIYQRFGGVFYRHLQGRGINRAGKNHSASLTSCSFITDFFPHGLLFYHEDIGNSYLRNVDI